MAISHVVLDGFGNGTVDTDIKKVTLFGYHNGYVTGTINGTLDNVTGKMRQSAATALAVSGLLLAIGIGVSFL